jgi:hypothetical protein
VRWAQLLVKGRAKVNFEKLTGNDWEPVSACPAEGPFKVFNYFKELARGHALIHGRSSVGRPDLALVGEVSISSVPGHLRPIIRSLRRNESIESAHCAAICGCSRPAARQYRSVLSLLGIGALRKGSPQSNQGDCLTLSHFFSPT